MLNLTDHEIGAFDPRVLTTIPRDRRFSAIL